MDRKDFFYKQRVLQSELDAAFDYAEAAERNLWKDIGQYGILTGLTASLGSAPNVNITSGIGRDQTGKRIVAYSDGAGTKSHSYATATGGASTTVASGGNERWISIFAKPGRKRSDVRTDGNGATVYFDQPEYLNAEGIDASLDKFVIRVGTEAAIGVATRPALESDSILVCDISRRNGDAGNVLDTTRRQSLAIPADQASGLRISGAALTSWLGGRTNPAQTTLAAQLSKIITDLADTTTNDDGAERIGAAANAGVALSAGSVSSQLLDLATRMHMTGAVTWLGGKSFTVSDQIQTIVTNLIGHLGLTTTSDDGAEKIGAQTSGNLSVGSVRSQLDELDAEKVGLALNNSLTGENTATQGTETNPAWTLGAPSGNDKLRLWWLMNQASGRKLRLYSGLITSVGAGATFRVPELWLTINASYNGSVWSYDTGSNATAIVFRLPGDGTAATESIIRHKYHSGAGTWATTAWVNQAGLGQDNAGTGGGILLQSSSTPNSPADTNDIVVWYDGTNIKWRNNAGTIKTVTST